MVGARYKLQGRLLRRVLHLGKLMDPLSPNHPLIGDSGVHYSKQDTWDKEWRLQQAVPAMAYLVCGFPVCKTSGLVIFSFASDLLLLYSGVEVLPLEWQIHPLSGLHFNLLSMPPITGPLMDQSPLADLLRAQVKDRL